MKMGTTDAMVGTSSTSLPLLDRALLIAIRVIAITAATFLGAGIWLAIVDERGATLPPLHFSLLPAVLACAAASYGLRFMRWHVLARRFAHALSLRDSLRVYAIGFAFGLTPGRVGEMVKFGLLRQVSGTPELESVALYPVERFSDALTFLLLAIAGSVFAHLTIGRITAAAALTVAALPVLAVTALLLRRRATLPSQVESGGMKFRLKRLLHGVTVVGHPATLVPALVLALAARLGDATMFWLVTRAAGLSLSFAATSFAWGIAGLSGGLSLMPAGLAAVEASIVATLSVLGVGPTNAFLIALFSRLMTLWLWAPPGLYLAWRRRSTFTAFAPGNQRLAAPVSLEGDSNGL